jgi:hypothetical protein
MLRPPRPGRRFLRLTSLPLAAAALALMAMAPRAHAVDLATRQAAVSNVLAMPTCDYVSSKLAFYWEVGDANGLLYARQDEQGQPHANRDQVIPIASASKWLYATYVVEPASGQTLNEASIARLSLSSDAVATHPASTDAGAITIVCNPTNTVAQCAARQTRGGDDGQIHPFSYGGAHLQSLAGEDTVIRNDDTLALGTAISNVLQLPGAFAYGQPALAGGVRTSPATYAAFLQKMLKGAQGQGNGYALGALLDADLVCAANPSPASSVPSSPYTQPNAWPEGSVANSPFPLDEPAQYGLGHWVESALTGTPGYSSPGSFGFYPSIDADKQIYVIVSYDDEVVDTAHGESTSEAYLDAMYCGRNVRRAWLSGVASDPYASVYLHH